MTNLLSLYLFDDQGQEYFPLYLFDDQENKNIFRLYLFDDQENIIFSAYIYLMTSHGNLFPC